MPPGRRDHVEDAVAAQAERNAGPARHPAHHRDGAADIVGDRDENLRLHRLPCRPPESPLPPPVGQARGYARGRRRNRDRAVAADHLGAGLWRRPNRLRFPAPPPRPPPRRRGAGEEAAWADFQIVTATTPRRRRCASGAAVSVPKLSEAGIAAGRQLLDGARRYRPRYCDTSSLGAPGHRTVGPDEGRLLHAATSNGAIVAATNLTFCVNLLVSEMAPAQTTGPASASLRASQ